MSGIFPNGGVSPGDALPSNLPEIETTGANCNPLYNNSRCNARVDPASVNSIIAEIGNAVNGAGLNYDCSKYDNLLLAIENISKESLFRCLEKDFPSSANSCSIQYLVVSTDAAGCKKIASYSQASARIGSAGNSSVWGQNQPLKALPEAPGTPATFYTQKALWDAQMAGTVDMGRLVPNWIFNLPITLACDSIVTLEVLTNVVFSPQANSGNGANSVLAYSVDGVFPTPPSGYVPTVVEWTNFQSFVTGSITVALTAGLHVLDFYALAKNSDRPPAQIYIEGSAVSSQGSVTASIQPN